MAQHYQEFQIHDPAVIPAIIARWPFATIVANGPDWPVSAHAPITISAPGTGPEICSVEFHLAKANPAFPHLGHGTKASLILQGPSAHISPSWYRGRFPGPESDRSRTAPTWNYLSLHLQGALEPLSDAELVHHIETLVANHEDADDGWQIKEIADDFFTGLRQHILGYRLKAQSFTCIAKFSQDKGAADIPHIVEGLRMRGLGQDSAVADLVLNLQSITGRS